MWDFAFIFGRRNRFLFWGTVPIGAVLLTLMSLTFAGWTLKRAIIVVVLDLTFLFFAIGIYDAMRFTWALRICMAIVFLGYCGYVVNEFLSRSSRLFDAFHGLLAIGVPALLFALRGFSRKLKKIKQSDLYSSPRPIHPK